MDLPRSLMSLGACFLASSWLSSRWDSQEYGVSNEKEFYDDQVSFSDLVVLMKARLM